MIILFPKVTYVCFLEGMWFQAQSQCIVQSRRVCDMSQYQGWKRNKNASDSRGQRILDLCKPSGLKSAVLTQIKKKEKESTEIFQ